MDQATLDIKYTQLLQWLEDRYLIPRDWPSRLEIIKSKKTEILDILFKKETPDMKKIQNTFKSFKNIPIEMLPYNDFSKLYTQLQKTEEAKEKTLLGYYKSPLLYSAYVLDGIYKKNNMHLAENAKIIIQNVCYDIPLCKKAINDINSSIKDHENKSLEKTEQISSNREKIRNLLKSNELNFDIEAASSKDIALSLIERLSKDNTFANMLNDYESKIKRNDKVRLAMDIYEDFFKMLFNSNNEVTHSFTPRLKKFYENGDYPIIEGDEASSEEMRKNAIEYREKVYKMKYTDQVDTGSYNFNIVGEEKKKDEEREPTATCLLDNRERNLLIADINEIIIFITQRLNNANNKDEINLAIYNQPLKEFNLKYSGEEMGNAKSALEEIMKVLEGKEFLFICDLFNDENALKTIVDTFNEIKIRNLKLSNLVDNYKKKNEELKGEIKENEKKIMEFKKQAVMIRKVTEMVVTKELKRKINIMGDENLISK